jgi:hypothetical protein
MHTSYKRMHLFYCMEWDAIQTNKGEYVFGVQKIHFQMYRWV